MNWYKKAQEIYRGDTSPLDIENYDPEYGVKNLGKELGSSAAFGPGIYFVTAKDIAEMYGTSITKKFLDDNANIITKQKTPFNYQQIDRMLKSVNKEKMEIAISNWDEEYSNGKRLLIQSIVNEDNPLDQLMNIWSEVFAHQNANDFIRLMLNSGIDGISINKDNATYYIIYNKDMLK